MINTVQQLEHFPDYPDDSSKIAIFFLVPQKYLIFFIMLVFILKCFAIFTPHFCANKTFQ